MHVFNIWKTYLRWYPGAAGEKYTVHRLSNLWQIAVGTLWRSAVLAAFEPDIPRGIRYHNEIRNARTVLREIQQRAEAPRIDHL